MDNQRVFIWVGVALVAYMNYAAYEHDYGTPFATAPVAQTAIRSHGMGEAPSPAYVSDFLATTDGLALTKAFMRITEPKLRRRIVELVQQIAATQKD